MSGELRIGAWVVQRDLNLLSDGQTTVEIEPKVMEVLVYLAEHAGAVLSKSTIMQALWPDTCVTPEVLTYSIFEIRKAFGDDAKNPRFIQTIPRRGYRLIAPVTRAEDTSERSVTPAAIQESERNRLGRGRLWTRWLRAHLVLSILALEAVMAGISLWVFLSVSHAGVSLAVVPFESIGTGGKEDLFSKGLTEELITEMAHVQPELRVITCTAALQYPDVGKSIRQIGRELNVAYILEGTVRREGERVRVSVQLVQVRDQTSLWAESYDRQLGSALDIENEIARAVASKIRLRLSSKNSLQSSVLSFQFPALFHETNGVAA